MILKENQEVNVERGEHENIESEFYERKIYHIGNISLDGF